MGKSVREGKVNNDKGGQGSFPKKNFQNLMYKNNYNFLSWKT